MRKLEELTVRSGAGARKIALYHGDLTQIPREEAVDILVVSAFPDDYSPTLESLIGALDRAGVSVARHALDKETDLRSAFSCWLSRELTPGPGTQFKRLLCFEPAWRGNPPEVVTDIFQSLAATLLVGSNEMSVAMPLVASGDMRWPASAMLEPLLDAAVIWMERGLPLAELKIVEYDRQKAAELTSIFAKFRAKRAGTTTAPVTAEGAGERYHAVISYSHADTIHAERLAAELTAAKPNLSVFVDRESIDVGAPWLQRIFEAIESCEKVIALLSPAYLTSRYCAQEFLATMNRENKKNEKVLFPLYLFSIEYIPAPYDLYQFHDCREGNHDQLRAVSQKLITMLTGLQ